VFLLGCKKNENVIPSNDISEIQENLNNVGKHNIDISGCYIYSQDSSYIEMEIIHEGEQILGTLKYKLFEKDANLGTIAGKISDSILIADYKFTSEGTQSTRQIAFLIKNNQLIEGYGEVEVNGKIATFKNIEDLDFSSSKVILKKHDCSTL